MWEQLGIAAGTALFSDMLAQDNADDQRNFIRQQQQENAELQREFAQHGVRWRVEDAKAAGLHPLYALNSGGAAYAPNAVAIDTYDGGAKAVSDMGQNVSRAVAAQETGDQRTLKQAQLRVLEAQAGKDDAQAAYYRSEANRLSQPAAAAFPGTWTGGGGGEGAVSFPIRGPMTIEERALTADARVYKPDEMVSAQSGFPGVTAGHGHPGFSEFKDGAGRSYHLPSKAASEPLESTGESMLALLQTIQANSDRGTLRNFGSSIFGVKQMMEALDAIYAAGGDIGTAIAEFKRKDAWLRSRGERDSWNTKWTGRGPAPWNR